MNHQTAVVFDFDGTIALGDGPVRAYARHVESLAGISGIEDALIVGVDGVLDGYDAVRVLAEAQGVSAAVLSQAYLASRGELGTEGAPISAPEGLRSFIDEARAAGALVVLVTNAPDIRIAEALSALGLDDAFDRVVTGAGKPAGFGVIFDELASEGFTKVLSIGDIWHNDLAPAQARGFATALVGDNTDPSASPLFRGESLTDILPDLRGWALNPASSFPHLS